MGWLPEHPFGVSLDSSLTHQSEILMLADYLIPGIHFLERHDPTTHMTMSCA